MLGTPHRQRERRADPRRHGRARGLAWLFLALAAPAEAQAPPAVEPAADELKRLLALSLDDLLNLPVATALKQPSTINQVPATVRVITAEEIAQRGYLTLEDALADLPGFQFRNIVGFNSYVFVRGVPSQNNKILLLVDGVQVNELNSGGFYGGGQHNLANVQQIEIVYGPASTLYGTNAVSGVVNLVTRTPDRDGGRLSLSGGSFDTRSLDVLYGRHASDRRLGFSLAGMYKHSDKADLRGTKGDGNWTDAIDPFETDASLDARAQAGDVEAGLSLQDKDASRATVQRTADGLLSDHGVNWHIRFLNAWASYAYDKGRSWSLRSTAYYRSSTVLRDTVPVIELPTPGSPGRQLGYYRPGWLVGDETRLEWTPAPSWNVSVGLVLEQERLSETFSVSESRSAAEPPPAPASPPSLSNGLLSVYGQARVPLASSLALFAGLRHDESSYYGSVDTPRLGLVWNADALSARLLYVEAFRAPKPWDFTDGLGNPGLEPERMRSFEASGAWSVSRHLRVDLAAYHNRLAGLLEREEQDAGYRWTNAGRVDTDGVETALEYRRGGLRAFASYSYTDSRDQADRPVPEIAAHGAASGIAYTFSRSLGANLRCRYVGSRDNPALIPATGSTRLDDALVLDAAASLELIHGIALRLFVDNLTDAEYYDPSNLPPSRYRQPQRSFRLKAEYAF